MANNLVVTRTTADRIHKVWKTHEMHFDDILAKSSGFRQVFFSNVTVDGMDEIMRKLDAIKNENAQFFVDHDYNWCMEKNAYRTLTEANLQYRLLVLLINYAKIGNIPSDTIVCRQAFTPGTSLCPRCTSRDGISFIIFPLGWSAQMYLACGALSALEKKDVLKSKNFIRLLRSDSCRASRARLF